MKRFLSIILIVLLAVCCFAGCENKSIKDAASDFQYILVNKDGGYITITGYTGENTHIEIPQKIEGYDVRIISSSAFVRSDIESVIIPDTVLEIENNAFSNCANLHTVVLGDSVETIGPAAFYLCSSLKNINLPSKIKSIHSDVFLGCASLEKIIIPKSVTQMGSRCFYGSALSSVTFEDGIETIGSLYCFWDTQLKNVVIPSSVNEIGEYCFDENLKEVHFLGDSPETIGDKPFHEDTIIYYNKSAKGWHDSLLKDYRLVAE